MFFTLHDGSVGQFSVDPTGSLIGFDVNHVLSGKMVSFAPTRQQYFVRATRTQNISPNSFGDWAPVIDLDVVATPSIIPGYSDLQITRLA